MIDGVVDIREISINAQLFIRATNEDYIPANTYQIIDTTGAFYNLPAFPSEFILIDLAGNRYTPATSEGLIEDSKNLAPFSSSTANKANSDASNVAPYILEWHDALELYSRTQIDQMLLAMRGDSFRTGPISTTANLVQLALSPDGTNSVTIAGTTLSKTTPDSFPYTPVGPGKLKALVLYAKATAQIFYLAEGVQGDEAVSPDFEGLFIASITVSDGGQIVNPAGPQDFLYQSNDAWITQQISGPESLLVAGNNPGNTFDISVKTGTANPGIAGITAEQKLLWEGRIFWLRNNSPVDIVLVDTPVSGELTRFSLVQFEKPAVLKKAGWAAVKIKQGVLVVIGLGGGASFPEGGTRGDVLEWDVEGATWTNRLTLAEQEIDAEANARQTAINAVNARYSNVVDKFLHIWDNTAGKWISSGLKLVTGTINQLEFTGRIKADAIVLPNNTNPAVANRLRSDGNRLYYANAAGVEKGVGIAQSNVFVYTPSGDFTISQVKTAMEAEGRIFNDGHIIIDNASSNYVCTIDINIANALFTVSKSGSGNVNFITSGKPLIAGSDNVKILSGSPASMALITTTIPAIYLTIRTL